MNRRSHAIKYLSRTFRESYQLVETLSIFPMLLKYNKQLSTNGFFTLIFTHAGESTNYFCPCSVSFFNFYLNRRVNVLQVRLHKLAVVAGSNVNNKNRDKLLQKIFQLLTSTSKNRKLANHTSVNKGAIKAAST